MSIKNFNTLTFTGNTTEPIYLDTKVPVGIMTPDDSSFDNATLNIHMDKGFQSFVPVYDSEGNMVTIAIGKSRYIAIDIIDYIGVATIKFVSNADLSGKTIVVATADVLR